MTSKQRPSGKWSYWRLRFFILAAAMVVVIMLPPSGGSVNGMRSLPRAILREDWGPLEGATLEEAAKNKEAEDRAYLEALINAYGLTPALLAWLDKWWHPCWPTAALRWYPDDFPEPLLWIEDDDPGTGCDYTPLSDPHPVPEPMERWPFYSAEDIQDITSADEAVIRDWMARSRKMNPNEEFDGRICWAPQFMAWYPSDFPEPGQWIDDFDDDTSCVRKAGPWDVEVTPTCTWDGSTEDPSWVAIELDRWKEILEDLIALNAPGMSLEEASVQRWAARFQRWPKRVDAESANLGPQHDQSNGLRVGCRVSSQNARKLSYGNQMECGDRLGCLVEPGDCRRPRVDCS